MHWGTNSNARLRSYLMLLLAQQAQQIGGVGQVQPQGCVVDSDSGNCICADASGNTWDFGPDLTMLGPIMGPCNGIFCSGEWQCAPPLKHTENL